ncbi:MAG: divergent polysaccharide deacetylase family protein [Epsilonproteobacteria bacterium]|nr:divergent polysaccharide deacetylase family protein [Campylobacterota bacterium]
MSRKTTKTSKTKKTTKKSTKTAAKKTRTKKKSTKKSSSFLKYFAYFLFISVVTLGGMLGYLIDKQKQKEKEYQQQLKQKEKALQILQEKVETLKKETKTSTANVSSEIEDYLKAQKLLPPPTTHKQTKKEKPKPKHQKVAKAKPTPTPHKAANKPKLVIIIDDMAYEYQVKLLKDIPYQITPSFFPPSKRHPNTPVYAREFSHYMVHVPMEALNFHKEEANTLHISNSYATIKKQIDIIKKEFPRAKYINNHTGSKFTGNYNAMIKLLSALKKDNLGFVDSKTTPFSQAESANKLIRVKLYSRNIFLDNVKNPKYIRSQLQKAVDIAKKRGYAIAIGHPHKITLLTLKHSGDILKNVDVVYIDRL